MRTGAVNAADDIDFYRSPSIYNSVLRLKRITEEEKREEKMMKRIHEYEIQIQNQTKKYDNMRGRGRGSEKVKNEKYNKSHSQAPLLSIGNNINQNKLTSYETFHNFVWCDDQSMVPTLGT